MNDSKRISERVRAAIIAHEDVPRTYVCHHCRDKGVTLYEHVSKSCGYSATCSAPCSYCERGDRIKRGRAAGQIEGRAIADQPNRRLGGF